MAFRASKVFRSFEKRAPATQYEFPNNSLLGVSIGEMFLTLNAHFIRNYWRKVEFIGCIPTKINLKLLIPNSFVRAVAFK